MGGGGGGGGVCVQRWRAGRNVGEQPDMQPARRGAARTKFNKEREFKFSLQARREWSGPRVMSEHSPHILMGEEDH